MATPRRSARSQPAALSYKEPGELQLGSGDDSDLDLPPSSTSKARSAKKVNRKVRDEAPPSSSKKKSPEAPKFSSNDSLLDDEVSGAVVVKSKPNSIPMATVQWWEEEATNREKAISKLVNMLLQACGCAETLTIDMFSEERDVDEDVRTIETGPIVKSQLSAKDKAGKKLKLNMSEFWQKFIVNASDENILEINEHPFLRWLFALSTSQLKDLRFGACFAAMEMMIALLDRSNEVLDSVNKLDRLVQAGGTGKARNKEQLQGRLQLKIALESFMDQLFNSVFVHRHRDVEAEIRARCITTLGQCIAKYKTKFFDNSYLKYLGWSLNDKEHVVRLAAVDALAILYETHQVTELEMFTNRFRDRLVEMRMDVNNEVAGNAMRLLTIMARHKLLSQEQCEAMYHMLVESGQNVRSAAAAFIDVAYLDGVLTPLHEEEVAKGRSLNKHEMLLKGLIEMITTVLGSDIGDTAVHHIVEALLPVVPNLQDWSLVCNILMEDDDNGEDSLAPEDKAMLSKFLVAALRVAKDDPNSETRVKGKGKKGGPSGLAEGSLYISAVLANLLKKFSADPQTLKALVQIPKYLDLHVLTDRQNKSMKDAVDLLVEIANKGQEQDLLSSCVESLQVLKSTECVLKDFLSSVDIFLDSIRSELKKTLDVVAKTSRATSAQTMRIKRTVVLSNHLDLFKGHDDLVELIGQVLKSLAAASDENFPALAGKYFVSMATQGVLWRTEELFEAQDKEVSKINPKPVVELRDFILECLIEVSTSSLPEAIRLQAVLAMSDLMQVYGKRQDSRQWSDAMVRQLGCELNSDILKAVESVVRPIISGQTQCPDNMTDTVSMEALDGDQEDPSGLNKATVLSLVKAVLYHGSAADDLLAELVATILLYVPYNAEFHLQLYQILTRKIADWRIWLLCHQKVYERVLHKAQAKEDVSELTSHMIDAVGSTPLHPSAVQGYLLEAFQWALKGMPRTLGFLDVVSLHVKSLSTAQARTLLDNITDLCSKKRINLATKDSSPIQNIIAFQKKIQDQLKLNQGRAESSNALLKSPEPSKRSRSARGGHDGADDVSSPRSGILETPISSVAALDRDLSDAGGFSDDDSELPTQTSARSAGRGNKGSSSGRKNSAKGKPKRKMADEEDEEGFVSVKRAK